jgi:hypothetical protein
MNQAFLASELHFDGGEDTDTLQVFDSGSGATDYAMSSTQLKRDGATDIHYSLIEHTDWHLNDENNQVRVASTHANTSATVFAYDGDDALTARGMQSELIFAGDDGEDFATLRAGLFGGEIVIHGEQILHDGGTLTTSEVEGRGVIGQVGSTHVTIQGMAGTNEQFRIEPSMKRHAGNLIIGLFSPVEYDRIQTVEVFGNAGEADSLIFEGASNPGGNQNVVDVFDIYMGAAGTLADPVAVLRNNGGQERLRLLNYHNIDVLEIDGMSGPDDFNVYVSPNSAVGDREIALYGGLSNDTLSVIYQSAADFVWNEFGASGDMDFLYSDGLEDQLFRLSYHSMETVDVDEI